MTLSQIHAHTQNLVTFVIFAYQRISLCEVRCQRGLATAATTRGEAASLVVGTHSVTRRPPGSAGVTLVLSASVNLQEAARETIVITKFILKNTSLRAASKTIFDQTGKTEYISAQKVGFRRVVGNPCEVTNQF